LNRLSYSYRLAMVLAVVLLSGGYFTLNASASSQPGDFLYTLKLGLERAGLVVPEQVELPEQISPQFEWERHDNGNRSGYLFGIQDGDDNLSDSFPDDSQEPLALVADQLSQEESKEEEKDLREEAKEEEQELKEAEKDQKEDAKEVEKDLKTEEKLTKKPPKVKDKTK
jgi:hypothetical protein